MLVIEPSTEIRDLLQHIVVRLGHEAVEYGSTADAAAVDVVILDPTANGAENVARYFAREHPAVPLVCVSVYPRAVLEPDFDCRAYVEKPFTQREIADALSAALRA